MRNALLAVVAAAVLVPAPARSEERATTKEAQRLVQKAVEFLKREGKEKAYAVFSDPKGRFAYRDLYVVVYGLDGACHAHGANASRIGKKLLDEKDADGKEFVKERVEIAKRDGKGWQEYKFRNPANGKIEDKVAYFELVGDVIVLSGAYKP